ncbi:MAG TPA: hypothetical protein VGG03_21345 [Thermoanaerobaculia bacterium]|jgi:hypothetical protein
MKRRETLDPEQVRALLRRGDPARRMAPEEAARIRGLAVRAAERSTAAAPPPARLRWGAVLAVAGVLALAAGLGWRALGPGRPERSTPGSRAAATAAPAERISAVEETPGEPVRPYQIQFRTRGGTRVIWVLTPDPNRSRRAL